MRSLALLALAAATLGAPTRALAQAPGPSPTPSPLFDLLDQVRVEPQNVRALIARGADVNAPGGYRHLTPLLKAVDRAGGPMADPSDLALVRILIAAGANVHRGVGSETPLCNAISPRPSEDLVLVLLRARADPNVACGGDTPLDKAVIYRSVEIVTMLLEAGARVPSIAGKINADPLLNKAALYGPSRLVSVLIRHGARVDERGYGQGTALMRAKNVDVARVLVAAGADVQARDHAGQSVLAIHAREGRREIAAFLRSRGATDTPSPPGAAAASRP
jgi:ankyrin repeat protein